ncbi:hypothetical protein VTH8203_03632 [Vibrio thalassae]|uniref:Uncharacterized protein n=1 Tax=Vibrio thalassae TaxID=1243014 RepID=A0A240EMZ9_9VIBR|nr:hypothetical protein VTH8203_03632 [Vibrio thalassae]
MHTDNQEKPVLLMVDDIADNIHAIAGSLNEPMISVIVGRV